MTHLENSKTEGSTIILSNFKHLIISFVHLTCFDKSLFSQTWLIDSNTSFTFVEADSKDVNNIIFNIMFKWMNNKTYIVFCLYKL